MYIDDNVAGSGGQDITVFGDRSYRFDVSDSSMSGLVFALSTTVNGQWGPDGTAGNSDDGTEYTTGKTSSGTAGSGGSNAFSNTLASRSITANADNTTITGNVSVANAAASGNISVSSVSTGGNVNSHTLSTNEMPSHSHSLTMKISQHNCRGSGCGGGFQGGSSNYSWGSQNTNNAGGSGGHSHGFSGSSHNHNASFSGSNHSHNASFSGNAHNHSISVGNLDMAVQYIDVIVATKD